MKINGSGNQHEGRVDRGNAERPAALGARPAETPGTPRSMPVRAQDRLDLSSGAREVAALSEAASRLPEIREERVRAVRESLDRGTYRVDVSALARVILEFEDALPR